MAEPKESDNVERQNREISLLQAMYPEEFYWVSDSVYEVFHHLKKAN
jgi:hypothetical protein